MMQVEAFAPVETLTVVETELPRGVVSGTAAPAGGLKPCAVMLVAGQRMLAVARATSFSEAARQSQSRMGWSGFRLGGLAQGLALGADVELQCWVSRNVLKRWTGEELASYLTPVIRQPLKVGDVRPLLAAVSGAVDVAHVLPFAVAMAQTHTEHEVLDATYRYLLGRPLDPTGSVLFQGTIAGGRTLADVWSMILNSQEFLSRGKTVLPGPFEAEFPFPLTALDGGEVNRVAA